MLRSRDSFTKFLPIAVLGAALILVSCSPGAAATATLPAWLRPTAQGRPGAGRGAPIVRTVLVADTGLGRVTEIRLGDLHPAPGPELGVAGTGGVVFYDPATLAVKARADFHGADPPWYVRRLFDIDGDGAVEIVLASGSRDSLDVFEIDGRPRWSFPKEGFTWGGLEGVGDLDGDGRLEFAIGGFEGRIVVVDYGGDTRLVIEDAGYWPRDIRIVDLNGDGRGEIVYLVDGGHIVVRDGRTGRRLSETEGGGAFDSVPWPAYREGEILTLRCWICDVDSRTYSVHPGDWGIPVWVRLDPGRPPILATLSSHRAYLESITISMLRLYDADGRPMYVWQLPEACGALAVLPQSDGSEALLVGGEGRVWKYEAADR